MKKSNDLVISILVYCLFAIAVFILQGHEPPLMVDHPYYFKQADILISQYPNRDFWKATNSFNFYIVLISYLYKFTGSHIESVKALLLIITVAYLFSFQKFASIFIEERWKVRLYTIVSAFFISFGASFWGMTDFSASVSRSLVVPMIVLFTWVYFRNWDAPSRFTVFLPVSLLSFMHGSLLHFAGVLLIVELIRALILMNAGAQKDAFKDLSYLLLALVIAALINLGLDQANLGIGYSASHLMDAESSRYPILDHQTAWNLEIAAFPWRNMPIPLATLCLMLSSFGVILLLAISGGYAAYRRGFTLLDRQMLIFAIAVLMFSYGLQTTLWGLRNFTATYPFGIEEVRAICLIVMPAFYFIYRLNQILGEGYASKPTRDAAITIILSALIVLQPILLVKQLPDKAKNKVIAWALETGLIPQGDSMRLNFAKRVMGIETEGARFYYSSRGLIQWLNQNTTADDVVLSNLDELILLRNARVVGSFYEVVNKRDPRSSERIVWHSRMRSVAKAVQNKDYPGLLMIAKQSAANFIVIPWNAGECSYWDGRYCVKEIPRKSQND